MMACITACRYCGETGDNNYCCYDCNYVVTAARANGESLTAMEVQRRSEARKVERHGWTPGSVELELRHPGTLEQAFQRVLQNSAMAYRVHQTGREMGWTREHTLMQMVVALDDHRQDLQAHLLKHAQESTTLVFPLPPQAGSPDIGKRVVQIFCEHLGLDGEDIPGAHTPLSELGMDSLDRLEMQFLLEEEFDLRIFESDAEKWITVGDVVAYVTSKQKVT
jgi:acyl carrier protein